MTYVFSILFSLPVHVRTTFWAEVGGKKATKPPAGPSILGGSRWALQEKALMSGRRKETNAEVEMILDY